MADIKPWLFLVQVMDEDYTFAKNRLRKKLDGEDYLVVATVMDVDLDEVIED
jgi:hypothetical protein